MNTTRSKNNRLLSFFLCCIMLCAMPSVTNAYEVLSPMPQSITQSTPDYIAQAKAGQKKYYPQYEEYFKGIFVVAAGHLGMTAAIPQVPLYVSLTAITTTSCLGHGPITLY